MAFVWFRPSEGRVLRGNRFCNYVPIFIFSKRSSTEIYTIREHHSVSESNLLTVTKVEETKTKEERKKEKTQSLRKVLIQRDEKRQGERLVIDI